MPKSFSSYLFIRNIFLRNFRSKSFIRTSGLNLFSSYFFVPLGPCLCRTSPFPPIVPLSPKISPHAHACTRVMKSFFAFQRARALCTRMYAHTRTHVWARKAKLMQILNNLKIVRDDYAQNAPKPHRKAAKVPQMSFRCIMTLKKNERN